MTLDELLQKSQEALENSIGTPKKEQVSDNTYLHEGLGAEARENFKFLDQVKKRNELSGNRGQVNTSKLGW